jgi:hypothetical protein
MSSKKDDCEEGDSADDESPCVEVPMSMVTPNPWGENVEGKLPQILAEIGTLDMWCKKFGLRTGDTWTTIKMVARLVNDGTKTWRFNPTIAMVCETVPGCIVTASTWWILVRSENHTDELLYKKLSEQTDHFHPDVWRPQYTLSQSKQLLRRVHKAQHRELVQWIRERAAEECRFHMRVHDPQVPL